MPLALGALVVAFLITALLGTPAIAWLRRNQLGDQIREVGLEHHQAKRGTPTMGGLLMIGVTLALALLLEWRRPQIWPLLLALAGFGLLGALDDLAKIAN